MASKKHITKIDSAGWLGDMMIAGLEEMAELLLFRLTLVAEQAAGWLMAGNAPLTLARLAQLGRVPESDVERLMQSLIDIGRVAYDEERGAYYLPDKVKAAEISRMRSQVAQKGGGNPALKRRREAVRNGGQRDLFIQNAGNVIQVDKSKTYAGKPADAAASNNIYINNNISKGEVVDLYDRYYFAHGCIRLQKKQYQAWAASAPFVDLDKWLVERAEWLETRSQSERDSWFYSTPHALRKANARFMPADMREGGAL